MDHGHTERAISRALRKFSNLPFITHTSAKTILNILPDGALCRNKKTVLPVINDTPETVCWRNSFPGLAFWWRHLGTLSNHCYRFWAWSRESDVVQKSLEEREWRGTLRFAVLRYSTVFFGFFCGISVILISNCSIAVFSEPAGCGFFF